MKPIRILKQAAAVVPMAMQRRKGNSRAALAERLAPLKGASTKIAQLLAARDGEDAGRVLEPVPLAKLMPTLLAAAPELLGDGAAVDPEGRRASLGQVHRARLTDGRDAALKVLLPGVEADLRSDLAVVGWMGRRAARKLNERFDDVGVGEWVSALGDELVAELDYPAEGTAQRRFRDAAARIPDVIVPEVILARDKVLISAWEGGAPLTEAAAWEPLTRARLGVALASACITPMLTAGLVHGDLHPGNVAFRKDGGGEAVLYDFGATRELSAEHRRAWHALMSGTGPAWNALVALGFDGDRLGPVRDRIDQLTALIFAPFRAQGPVQIDGAMRRAQAEELLGDQRMVPRLAAPTSAIPAIRTLSGLLSTLGHLSVPMELSRVLEGAGDSPAELPPPREAKAAPVQLIVKSHGENGRGVEIALPFASLQNLEALLPASARGPIEGAGVNIGALAREALAKGPVPQTLYAGTVDGRRIELRVGTP